MENIEYIKEASLKQSLSSISFEGMKIIQKQMEKSICKIHCGKDKHGTGFFCLIPFPDKINLLKVLITNDHVLSKNDLIKGKKVKISINNNDDNSLIINIDEERKIFNLELPYDISLIEIKYNEGQHIGLDTNSFLDLDKFIYEENPNNIYKQKTVYIIHYPFGKALKYSLGMIKQIYEDNINLEHTCETEAGSSGSPIINLETYNVIGIHKGYYGKTKFNIGTFIKTPIEKFIKNFLNNIDIFSNKNISIYSNGKKVESSSIIDKEDARKNGFLLIGKTGVGKSTLINVLCNQGLAEVGRGMYKITQQNNIYYHKLQNGKCISIIDIPGLYDTINFNDRNFFTDLLKFIQKENIQIKGIFYLIHFQNEKLDSIDKDILMKTVEIFPLKNFWEKLIIIYTHYFSDPEGDDIKEMKENRNPKKYVINIMEKVKEDCDIIDFDKINIKYLNNYWPIRKDKKNQIIKNEQNRNELEILIENLLQKEALFWKIEIIKKNSIILKEKDKNYNAEESLVKYYGINNNLLKEKIFFMNIIEQPQNCIIF